MIDIKCA